MFKTKEEINWKELIGDEVIGINKINEIKYSPDAILEQALLLLKASRSEDEVKEKFKLTDDDMELLDFVLNEY